MSPPQQIPEICVISGFKVCEYPAKKPRIPHYASFRSKDQAVGSGMKSCGGLRPSFSAHLRWCEHGAPVWICGTRHRLEGEACVIPHLAKNQRDAPNFLYAALDRTACAPFINERRMKFREPTKLHRKSGMWGTWPFVLGKPKSALSWRDRQFLPRYSHTPCLVPNSSATCKKRR